MHARDKEIEGFIYLDLFYKVRYIQGYSGNRLKY